MALKIEDHTFGEYTIRCKQMAGMKSIKMFARLAKLLGPALSAMMEDAGAKKEGFKGVASMLDQDAGPLADAIGQFCEQLDPDEVERIALEFAADCKVIVSDGGGKEVGVGLVDQFDAVFAGGVDRFFGWVAVMLKLNYSGFLDGAAALGNAVASPNQE